VTYARPQLPPPAFCWEAEDHGYVVGAKWVPGCDRLVAGCLDGSVLQIHPLLVGSKALQSSDVDLDAAADAAMSEEEATQIIFRHPHALDKIDAKPVPGHNHSLRAVAASTIGQLSLIEVNVERAEAISSGQWAHAGRVSALALGPSYTVSAGRDGSCSVWDMRLKLHSMQIGTKFDGQEEPDATSDVICAIALDPTDGPYVVTSTIEETINLYDIRKAVVPVFKREVRPNAKFC